MKKLILIALLFAGAADAVEDIRYCEGEPTRTASGEITRSSKAIRDFRKLHACPETGLFQGACPGWAIDHVIPRAVGGCDQVFNMQWLPVQIKSCAGKICKDRWERDVYFQWGVHEK